jgi:5-methylcytosine-specific restriction endonuclease McrA
VHENHFYMYACPRVRRALMNKGTGASCKLKRTQRISTIPALSEWTGWAEVIAPGHYFCQEEDLDTIRSWFLNRNRQPKVLLRDSITVRCLSYTCTLHGDGCSGALVIHGLPRHCREIETWVAKLDLGIVYQGQGMAGTSLKVLKLLVRAARERVSLSGEEKAELLEKHGHRCAQCGARGGLQMDHIARVSDSFLEQKFQALCVECHSTKTRLESKRHENDEELSSHFELAVWNDYVLSPRAPPLVFRAKELEDINGCMIADVRRCRRNALLENVHRIPLFCPLDEIVPRWSGSCTPASSTGPPSPTRSRRAPTSRTTSSGPPS